MTVFSPVASSPAVIRSDAGLPAQAGAGFKSQHLQDWLADANPPAFFEVHAENYMGDGGAPHAWLSRMRAERALSLHGVGLSLGGTSAPDSTHLDRLSRLIERYQPASFSEHLAWSTHDGRFYSDLLPLAYDAGSLDRVCEHIDQVQSRLGLRMLLENPSSYLAFEASDIDEPEFMAAIVNRTGCGLLLDVNNVFVSCHNLGRDPHAYLAALPLHAVGEIHLAGHARDAAGTLLVDDHGAPVTDAVWRLYADVLVRIGPIATLIEWDNHVPAYGVLREEVRHSDLLLDAARMRLGAAA